MTSHNWKQTEIKDFPDLKKHLKVFSCDRCKEKSVVVVAYIDFFQNYTTKYDMNWNADCDLAVINLIHDL